MFMLHEQTERFSFYASQFNSWTFCFSSVHWLWKPFTFSTTHTAPHTEINEHRLTHTHIHTYLQRRVQQSSNRWLVAVVIVIVDIRGTVGCFSSPSTLKHQSKIAYYCLQLSRVHRAFFNLLGFDISPIPSHDYCG